MKKSELRSLIKEEIKKTINEAANEVILSNQILDFLEERGVITGINAQKVHKDLTAFLKDKV